MGKAVQKAEKAADKAEKAQAKIPTKKVIKRELMTDNSNGKIKVKLHFEDMEKKPPSQLKVTDAPTAAVRRQIRREIRDSEDDNVGVEAASYAADTVDSSAHLLQEAHHSAQLQPYRAAARAEKQLEKANIHALQKKAEVEHPTSNPLSRWRQKQAIKRQYAAQKAGRSTVEGSARAAKEAAKKSEQAATFVARHRKGFAAVLGILLILAFLLNAVSSCSMMVEGIGAGIAAGSYAAADDDIVGAEAAYCAMEQALQQKLDHYEQTHDYDEYHYALDDIGHDPYVLTAILSAMHPGEWTLPQVMGTLEMLFDKQYILTETVESETRYRTETVTRERHARDPVTGAYLYDQWGYPIIEEYEYETQVPYTYRSVTVKLENFDLSHVPVYVMNEETLGRYAIYMATLGNRPDLFPDSDYIRQMLIEGYTKYDLPPEALKNARFAAMIKEAEKYLGFPYVWGGSNPSTSFDCSGYVCWVLNHSGWRVGHTSAQGLYNLCTPVSRSNARPGDLVFFKGTYKTNGVSHVGIYVGENRILPCPFRFEISPDKRDQFSILKELMNREDVTEVVNACDAGREGELIFRSVYYLADCQKPMKRLWISSMEDEAIRDGLQNLRPGSDFDGLYKSALCRAKADWLVGINATRYFSLLYGTKLNVGRVMSPTLSLLVQRESEISAFVPEDFFTVNLDFPDFTVSSKKFPDRTEAQQLAKKCQNQNAVVSDIRHSDKAEKAPALYDLTTLQRDANRLLGYTAQQTLDYLQALYEKKLCTYPRTDSRYLTDDMLGSIPAIVLCAAGICGLESPSDILAQQVCNSKKVSDHHAILPTMASGEQDLSTLPTAEQNILKLISRQVLMAVSGAYRYREAEITITCGEPFKTTMKMLLDAGWKKYSQKSIGLTVIRN